MRRIGLSWQPRLAACAPPSHVRVVPFGPACTSASPFTFALSFVSEWPHTEKPARMSERQGQEGRWPVPCPRSVTVGPHNMGGSYPSSRHHPTRFEVTSGRGFLGSAPVSGSAPVRCAAIGAWNWCQHLLCGARGGSFPSAFCLLRELRVAKLGCALPPGHRHCRRRRRRRRRQPAAGCSHPLPGMPARSAAALYLILLACLGEERLHRINAMHAVQITAPLAAWAGRCSTARMHMGGKGKGKGGEEPPQA